MVPAENSHGIESFSLPSSSSFSKTCQSDGEDEHEDELEKPSSNFQTGA
jgi:hypothetical protein